MGRERIIAIATLLLCSTLAPAQSPLQNVSAETTERPKTQSDGSVTGSVMDVSGTALAGASITLNMVGAIAPRMAMSGSDGSFLFDHVAAGSGSAVITLSGFDAIRLPIVLETGETLSLPTVTLKLSEVHIEVDAVVSTHELAAEQLHVEQQQRLLAFVPNFYVSYKWTAAPLSTGQKYHLAWVNVRDPANLLLVGVLAGFQQGTDEFNGYGQGAAGYGRRFGADLGNLVSGSFLGGAVLPSLFHQDPRYFYKGTGSVKSRLLYAVGSAVICRGDNGKPQFAWASVLGDLGAGAISNAYYAPSDRQGVALTFENGFLGVAGDALNGVVQEFFLKRLTTKGQAKP